METPLSTVMTTLAPRNADVTSWAELEPLLRDRVLPSLRHLLMPPQAAARGVRAGDRVLVSGFTGAGYPKAVLSALAAHAEWLKSMSLPALNLELISGASLGEDVEESLVASSAISRRIPFQSSRSVRRSINKGALHYQDVHLSQVTESLRRGYTRSQVAIIEVAAVEAEGLVLTTSSGASAQFVDEADALILEVNTSVPVSIRELHDVYRVEPRPFRQPIPISAPSDLVGSHWLPIDLDKVIAITGCTQPDIVRPLRSENDAERRMADHLIDFLRREQVQEMLRVDRMPIEAGIGATSDAVLKALGHAGLGRFCFYSEVVQDAMVEMLDAGQADVISGTGLTLRPDLLERVLSHPEEYRGRIILRPQDVSNSAEVIARLGVLALNTAIEADIYGHVNSSHPGGSDILNGIGGSGDFARNAGLSVFLLHSLTPDGKHSTVVPMATHVDHTEHDVDVLITEWGLADLRGTDPVERAVRISENCAHPDFKQPLRSYLTRAIETAGGHEPQVPQQAFSWLETA